MKNRQKLLVEEFSKFESWEDRYRHVIQCGKSLPQMEDSLKTEELKVKGCQSQVWLKADLNSAGEVVFRADSDASIVKGLVSLLIRIYSEATPQEILETEPDFLEEIGFKQNLSPNRTNGLFAMIKQMKYYATAFNVLAKAKR